MTRRDFIASAASGLVLTRPTEFNVGALEAPNTNNQSGPDDWLGITNHLDWTHPRIKNVVSVLSRGQPNAINRAQAAFYFVRDTIKFGFTRGFWDLKASEILARGYGYCNTKSTLFVALLRGMGIPARQIFVDIDAEVLAGFLNPGTPYVDHSYTEVWLDGAWRATDAYIVDQPTFDRAKFKIRQRGTLLGLGVHSTGVAIWDGVRPTFAQYNLNDPRPLGTKIWGPFQDVADFYTKADTPWNRLNPALRLGMGLMSASANARIESLRAPSM